MIAYTITSQNKVWMIDEANGDTIPKWCYNKEGYFVVEELPDDVKALLDSQDLKKAKDDKIMELYKTYNSKLSEDIDYMDTKFQCDKDSRDLIASTLSAGSVPDGFYWLDISNDKVSMTYTDLQGLSATILARGQGLFDTLQDYKKQVNDCTSTDEVDSIVWS